MINLELSIKDSDLNTRIKTLQIIDETALNNAVNRATKKISLWLKTHIAREIGHALGVKVSGFKKFRFKIKSGNAKNGKPAILWVGVAPIKAHYFKAPRWKRSWSGARSGGQTYEGSFIGNANGPKIFRRLSGEKTRNGRDKLEVVSVDVQPVIKEITKRLVARANTRFQTILKQEINFEISKLK